MRKVALYTTISTLNPKRGIKSHQLTRHTHRLSPLWLQPWYLGSVVLPWRGVLPAGATSGSRLICFGGLRLEDSSSATNGEKTAPGIDSRVRA